MTSSLIRRPPRPPSIQPSVRLTPRARLEALKGSSQTDDAMRYIFSVF